MPFSRSARRVALPLAVAMLAAPTMIAAPASAATIGGVTDLASLTAAIDFANTQAGADVIVLDAGVTIAGAGGVASISDDLTIELNGSSVVDLRLFVLAADLALQNGSWSALPAPDAPLVAPGIGVDPDSTLLLDGMGVSATGSACDAAIGGWFSAPGGPDQCEGGQSVDAGAITIVDSTVTATGGLFSAGIGGGSRSGHGALVLTSSTVTATGGSFGAGIGAGKDRIAGVITITDSTVTASGTLSGAGIGGSDRGTGGTVTITGGSVTATGAGNGAGIGGGFDGAGGSTTIGGDAAVIATGGSLAAGIGGGIFGAGGPTSIGGTATVTATGRDGAPGIGSAFSDARAHTTTITDGSPTVATTDINGALIVAAGAELAPPQTLTIDGDVSVLGELVIDPPATVTVPAGRTLTNSGTIRGTGELRGAGSVANAGIICAPVQNILTSSAIPAEGLSVTGTVTLLRYALPEGGELLDAVYASTLEAGCRALPDASTDERILIGWSLGVDGPLLTLTGELASLAPTGTAELDPVLVDAALTLIPSSSTAPAGSIVSVRAFGPVPLSGEETSELTASLTLAGDIAPGAGPTEFSATTAGSRTVDGAATVTGTGGTRVLRGSFEHVTTPAALSAITITPSALRVAQGGAVDITVTGTDAYSNAVDIEPGDIVVTSSVSTDVIDGLTVSFPTASPHVLTVTVGAVSAQVTIEVEAAPVLPVAPVAPVAPGAPAAHAADAAAPVVEPPLPATGSAGDLGGALLWAVVLLVAGAAVGLLRTRAE